MTHASDFRRPNAARGAAAALGLATVLAAGGAAAQLRTELVSHSALRVCADPHDLPFSDAQRQGFENKIADVVGAELKLPVSYVWFPQVFGFVRNTLRAQQCDLVMGAVSGDSIMENTNSYYHTGYMVVTRTADKITATALSDPVFADKRIGLIAATPPTDLLLRHGLMPHVHSYALAVDTRNDNPSQEMLQDLVKGNIDVALLWGPIAGYAITHDHLPLQARFLEPEAGEPRLDYRIAMGVRAGEPEWRRTIDQVIRRRAADIAHILADYGVPQLDEQNRPIVPASRP